MANRLGTPRSRILASAALLLGWVGAARAEPIPFAGTLHVELGAVASFVTTGGGVSTLNASAGLGHLDTLRIGGNDVGGTSTGPGTPGSIRSIVGTFSLAQGTFTALSGAPPAGGALGVQGRIRLCLLLLDCEFFFAVPLTANGTRGVGIGGLVTTGVGQLVFSIHANPWTIGTAKVSGIPTQNGGFTTSSRFGFAHGPQSATSSTARPGGVIQLVTPAFVQTTGLGDGALFSVLTIHFTPEPGTLLLTATGLAVLAAGAGKLRGQRGRSSG